MNTLLNDVRKLFNEKTRPGTIDRMREWVDAQLKHCNESFVKYDNTIEKSMELVQGLYNDDLSVILFVAPTQFGKTSTIFWAAHNLMTHIDMKYFVPYPYVFIMTGLNSNSWKEQTRERVLPCMQDNVWHNKDICKSENKDRLKDAVLSNYNTLIVIDEVHVGTKLDHVIFNTLLEFHPESSERDLSQKELFQFLHERKVKFILVSATPDAIKETMEQNWLLENFRVIVAYPDSAPSYVWHKDFLDRKRVHQAYKIDDVTPQGKPFHDEIAQQISMCSRPMYHMIRFPMDTKKAEIEHSKFLLKKSIYNLQIDSDIVLWDAKNQVKDYFVKNDFDVFENRSFTSSQMLRMSNEDILNERPVRHVIFILKEHFRVAQTMPINNIGVLVDRDTKTPCDSTLSQSLIGRACGHNKSQFIEQITIYTHVQSVKNYIKLWENEFDYSKVPGYKGNGLKTSNHGSSVKTNETMMGEKVKRNGQVIERTTERKRKKHNDADENQDDTPNRLDKVAKAFLKKNTIVYKIIDMFFRNGFGHLTTSQLGSTSKNKNINIRHYSAWQNDHGRYKIVEKIGDTWKLRQVIQDMISEKQLLQIL